MIGDGDEHPHRDDDPRDATQLADPRSGLAPGHEGGEDRPHPAEEVGHADQVGHHEVAVQARDRHQLLQHLDVHQHDRQEQRRVVGDGEEAGEHRRWSAR